ncbi:MAG: ASCH domain-containing protein [Lachnospiraceae bacterium]|nr:ASCH domain-containing protein [Lachnospiraceae bacterium]
MTAEQLWAEFCLKKNVDINTPYEAYGFGDSDEMADELAELVAKGVKFATASSYDEYVAEDALDELPKPGDFSVILNAKEEAVCVIRNSDVQVYPFKEVPASHAYAEGEGDRSLAYWRKVHIEFFNECAEESGIPFTEDSKVVCETFSLEYVASDYEPQ